MVRRKISRRAPAAMKISLWVVFAGLIIALVVAVRTYRVIFSPSIEIANDEGIILTIPTGSDYEWLYEELKRKEIIEDEKSFQWLAKKKNLSNHINPGRYRIIPGMSNNELINMIRSGKQEPVVFMFNHLRTISELAAEVSTFLEPDSVEFASYLKDPATAESLGFSVDNFAVMFIPNSYEFYWNTTPDEFAKRMKREYIAFWSEGRTKKAEKTGLSREEVSILASIVEQETLHPEENEKIAGVFMNRIKQGIPLQSDPTLIFALQNFEMRRVLNDHKKYDSPYNTYINRGLPPGPICIPSISAIDGVLDYEEHNYVFFCAKPDFSGYHNFARTLSQHNKNARLYQQALNRRKIYR
jgi:UPF0755 protein